METVKLALTSPIMAHGKEVTELEFRKPMGKEIRICGVPTKVEVTKSGTQMHHIDGEVSANLISMLAGIPSSSVDALSAPDFTAAAALISSFFGVQTPES